MNTPSTSSPLALVTGAARGIGRAIAERLLRDGSRVIALDRSAENLDILCRELPDKPIIPCVFDLMDFAALPVAIQAQMAEHGPITQLVNNAGVWPGGPIVEMTDRDWDLNLGINLTAPFILMRTVAAAMRDAGGGGIVTIASRNAFRSSIGKAAYDASKAGVLALTRTAAGEFAQWNIRVNAICPGVIATPGDAATIEDPFFKAAYLKQIPMNRYADPSEIASIVAFLLSAESSFVTGQYLIADGGQIACQDNKRYMEIPGLKI